jgi:hypothetical protein
MTRASNTVVELKAFFFHTLFQWIVAYDSFYISSFHDFFIFISYTLFLGVSLVYLSALWFLMNFIYLIKIKNKYSEWE